MNIISANAESKLVKLASSIGRSPQSWHGWYCLQILPNDLDEDLQQECLFLVKSLIGSYLKGSQIHIYFCEKNSIHIIVNAIPPSILEYAGQQICDLFCHENSAKVSYCLYDLSKDGQLYAQYVLDQLNDLLNFSIEDHSLILGGFDKSTALNDVVEPNRQNNKINDSNPKVLLVEDDPVTRWLVRQTLKESCDFATAQTANKAFNVYTNYQPDVVFLDINLPDKNGYDVLEWIVRNDPGANVVMFSSQNNLDSIASAIEMGATGFIGKPFVKQQLLNYIHSYA
ncbi:MAG: response regulator [Alphaproteobacteria bacterium]